MKKVMRKENKDRKYERELKRYFHIFYENHPDTIIYIRDKYLTLPKWKKQAWQFFLNNTYFLDYNEETHTCSKCTYRMHPYDILDMKFSIKNTPYENNHITIRAVLEYGIEITERL